ncbi:MAG TPA: TonB-dependent receptor [Bryobacteraceae bacterium]|nr:TonB-dependent receptor [Bryobacteraceae bacterium]
MLTLNVPAGAQVATAFAQLNGTVHDPTGAAVATAKITLRDLGTNQTFTTASNDMGFYVFPNLPTGNYELTAEYAGFSKYTRSGITLRVGQTATADIDLSIAAAGEAVTVTGGVAPIEPTKTEISQVIETKQIDSLPISGRLFTDFALLTPGVATGRTSLQSTITEFEVTRVSFGGMRDLSNEVTVDGADTINTVTGSQRSTPPQDAVSEFRVVNNSFGADYGRALGGIVNIVTKSGTNKWNGALYDYFQNNAMDARSLLQPAPQPDVLRQNQFGIELGGPLVKDKTFFFVNYEGQRRAESPTYPASLVNNLGFINAAKSALGLEPENLNILRTLDHDNGIIKVDHAFTSNTRLSVRYNIEDGRDYNLLVGNTLDGGGIGSPSSGHNAFIRDQSLVGTLTSVPSPSLVNTILAQWGRRHYDFPGDSGQPNLDIPNLLMFGHNFGVFDYIGESRAQFSDTASWVKGSHVIKFGVDTNFLFDKVTWPGFTPMRIVLPGLNCLVQFANFVNPAASLAENPALGPCPLPPFLNGTPIVFWGAPVGNGPITPGFQPPPIPTNWHNAYVPSLTSDFNVHLNHSYFGTFAEDQWRITPKLTLNYGLRWDYEAGLDNEINPDYKNFAPRVGIAYSPDSKTVIRAGYGVFFDRYSLSFVFVTYPQRPVVIPGVNLPGIRYGSSTAGWVLNQLTPGPAGFPADAAKTLLLTGQVPGQYITGQCPPSCTAGAGMVDHNSRTPYAEQSSFEIDREIGKGYTASAGYLFVAAHHQVRAENLNVSLPVGTLPDGKDLFAGPLYENAGLLYYTDNSGNSVYHGLTLQITKRYSQYFQMNANYTFSRTLDDGTFTTFVSTPQDLYKRNLERALSNQDVRHRFVANFVLDAPQKSFLRNFELSSIVTMESPRPFTLFVGFDANNDTNPVTDRVGQSARNTYEGDRLYTADVRLSRYVAFTERLRLTLAIDAFNLLNRPNVDEVFSVYDAPDFVGAVPRHYKDGVGSPVNPDFGAPRTMFNPRQLQLSARFSF